MDTQSMKSYIAKLGNGDGLSEKEAEDAFKLHLKTLENSSPSAYIETEIERLAEAFLRRKNLQRGQFADVVDPDIRKVEEYIILKARFNGLKERVQLYYPKVPERVVNLYKERVQEVQDRAKQVYNNWHEVEKEFKLMKSEGFRDKFQKVRLNKQRKMLKMEYSSVLNALSVILISIKSGNYI